LMRRRLSVRKIALLLSTRRVRLQAQVPPPASAASSTKSRFCSATGVRGDHPYCSGCNGWDDAGAA
jgi:hypothetical protein